MGIEFAYNTWKSLEDQLLPKTKQQEVHLKDKLATLKKGSLSVEAYQRKFKRICDNLAAINKPISDLDKVFQFARGLGPKYQDFRVAMLTNPPYPTFSQFVMALQSHDQLLETNSETNQLSLNHNQAFLSWRSFQFKRARLHSCKQVSYRKSF